MKETIWIVLVLLVLAAATTGPMWDGRMFYSHENLLPAFRLVEVDRNVREGHLFARWFPDYALGLGLPQLVFFPPLTLYLSELFHLGGLDLFASIEAAFVVGTLLCAAGTFLWASQVWSNWGAVVSAAAAIFAPYHLLNLYVRGDLHEYVALGWLPWILWAFHRLLKRPGAGWVVVAALLHAALMLTHNLTAVLFTPALLFYVLLGAADRGDGRALGACLLALVLAVGLGAFFWAPALLEKRYVQIDVLTQGFGDFRNHFIELRQFFSPYWGYGASVKGPGDTISFQIGNLMLLLALGGLAAAWRRRLRDDAGGFPVVFAVLLIGASIVLMMEVSAPLWETLPLLKYFQFPYRFLALAVLGASLLAGGAVELLADFRPRWVPLGAVALSGLLAVTAQGRCRVIGYSEVQASAITPETVRRVRETVATGEYVPRGVKDFPPPKELHFTLEKIPKEGFSREEMDRRLKVRFERDRKLELWKWKRVPVGGVKVIPQGVEILAGQGIVADYRFRGQEIDCRVSAGSPVTLRFGVFYFPGWRAWVDGEPATLQTELNTGLIILRLQPGTHAVTLRFEDTPLRRRAAWASGIALLACVVLLAGARGAGRR